MLGNEYWMTAEGGLLAIVGDIRRRQAPRNKFFGMRENHWQAFIEQVFLIPASQVKAAAEC